MFAHQAHAEQKQKGKDVPYIVHVEKVVALLMDVGADEETIAAAWLHDVAEDQGVQIGTIRELFGIRVARMVEDVSEVDKSLSWIVRKSQTVGHVKTMVHDSLLIKTADVIANTENMTEDYREKGEAMFEVFHAGKVAQVEHKQLLVSAIVDAWPLNPLLPQLTSAYQEFQEVFVV